MERLSSYEADRLNDALYGMDKDGVGQTQVSARYVRTDSDGTAWVRFEGADKDTPLTSAMSVTAREGDLIDVRLGGYEAVGGGNRTDPSAGVARVARVENLARDTAEESARTALAVVNAQQTADEANKVAQATNQHFFADDNGAHVTDVTQDEWNDAVADEFSDYDPDTKPYHNQLLNSLGILLRTALNNLVSITRSAIAFYDGAGNAASNIVARFGADGAQIGKSGAAHLELTSMTIAENASREGADTVFKTGFANDPTTGIASVTLTSYITWTIRVDDVRYFIIYTDKITPLAFSSLKVDGVTYPTSYLSVHELTGDILLDYSTFSSKLYSEIEVIYTTDELVPTFFYGTASLTSYTRTGANSAALGHNARAFGLSSFALGDTAKAIGNRSFATGQNTTASGEHSSAIGNQTKTTAQASNSISAGYNSVASAMCAMALGNGVVSANMSEVVIGEYNDYANDTNPDGFPQHNNRGNYALIVGNGTADNARSNALAVDWTGDVTRGVQYMERRLSANSTVSMSGTYSYTNVPLNTTAASSGTKLKASGNGIKVMEAGYYLISAGLVANAPYYGRVYAGSDTMLTGTSNQAAHVGGGMGVTARYLAANTTIYLKICKTGTTNPTVAGSEMTFLSVIKIG